MEEQHETQKEAILGYLLAGHRISPIKALNLYGCFRLAAYIYDLRKDGFNMIVTEMKAHLNRPRVKYAEYFISPGPSLEQARELAETLNQ